jgi:hypothetical protein
VAGSPVDGCENAARVLFEAGSSRLLKKPSMAFSTSPIEKRGFQLALIFNGFSH